jgi:hypothetical protein
MALHAYCAYMNTEMFVHGQGTGIRFHVMHSKSFGFTVFWDSGAAA